MQPEHTQAFQDTAPSTEPLPTSRISTVQHGIHSLSTALHSLGDLSQGADADDVRGIGDERESSDGAENTGISCDSNGCGDTALPKDDGDITSPPKQKKDIVSQYEARGASPPHCDIGFHVKKTDWQGRLDSPISKIPSEVLIHSLSFLDPQTLLTASLVSHHFHSLIASSDVWRSAFSRYFPAISLDRISSDLHESAALSSSQDRRFFTRLSAGGGGDDLWRKEYILRTRLLKDLARGKPHISASRSSPMSKNSQGSVVITYNALTGPMSHLAAGFSSRGVRLLHASVETIVATASDAIAGRGCSQCWIFTGGDANSTLGKVERPPLAAALLGTPTRPDLDQPILGVAGFEVATDMDTVGVVDLSEDVGWVYGENVPNGKCYVHPYSSPYRCASEKGFFLRHNQMASGCLQPAITAVWIAKKRFGGVLETSESQVGVMIGNSRGFVSIYGLSFGKEFQVTPTKMFCICPGIPVVSIKVDESYSVKRKREKSVWAAIVNALGEIYYLADPKAGWEIIPQTTRIPTAVHSSIFQPPPSTITGEDMGKKKIEEKELLLNTEYARLKQLWEGWGMDWFIELDWPGANIVLGRSSNRSSTGNEQTAKLVRYHFLSYTLDVEAKEFVRGVITSVSEGAVAVTTLGSVFGGGPQPQSSEKVEAIEVSTQASQVCERPAKWVATDFLFGDGDVGVITTSAIDVSNLALVSPDEDSGITGDVPGGNARLFAIGTNMGNIFVWNIRHQASSTGGDATPSVGLSPQRVIRTDSPRISTLALSSLYLVHGGNDGLVQAWDLLASTYSPVRIIHSRFSTRARRRLAQADGMALGLGNGVLRDNQFAARCLVLDPDPTRLRGAVALGKHIKYWCFSSSSSSGPNAPKRSKKPKVSGRVHGTPSTGRGDIEGIIKSDSGDLLKERERENKERIELEKRYGVSSGWAALNEEEMLEYARMISMETYEIEGGSSIESGDSSNTIAPIDPSYTTGIHSTTQGFKDAKEKVEDLELAQALRLSLGRLWMETPAVSGDTLGLEIWEGASECLDREVPLSPTVAGPSHQKRSTSYHTNSDRSPNLATPGGWPDADSEWPSVSEVTTKGKGKAQRHIPRAEEEELEMAIRLSIEEEERKGVLGALENGGQSQVIRRGKGKGR